MGALTREADLSLLVRRHECMLDDERAAVVEIRLQPGENVA
jgi:hypothetical protein